MSESRYSCGLLPTRILPLFLCVCWPVLLPAQIETDPALLPIPEPDLELLQPATQVKLSRAQDYFHHTAPSLDGRLLAEAYGKLGMVYQALQLQAAAKAA